MDVRETLERAGGATTTGEIDGIFQDMAQAAGGCGWAYADLARLPDQAGEYVASCWTRVPDDFRDGYFENECFFIEPCIRRARVTPTSFFWSNLSEWNQGRARGRTSASAGVSVMRLAFDHGLLNGLIVPLHGTTADSRPSCALLSLYFDRTDPPEAANPRVLSWLPVVAQAAHARMGEIAPERLTTDRPGGDLTPRERDILQWAAAGRTAEDTGDDLNISPRTVEKHLEVAMRKLGAAHKAHAVALAISRGLISL